ncbi:sugar transferase [Cellulomonas marina]|uniref:Exopolysaccharide biosynthesis polyprenyl glycosylphosphotransferase n=1 Tax=Cellulomonas marina TaxID=988821 RepID=A0A1I0X609_9CELL|nr:sugar transferase [Cellulomonas marina]GIG28938.1 exopolysaccharide biosynthesis polyprenyl glycosylphosphotransferase [Cellulomonas marina]SFA95810.1 exopolysaccharide biosynthesis polyprenyl glycosylphosphotransferase [Cellulomonas marina]
MTLAVDGDAAYAAGAGPDRRQRVREPRRSWASPQPYVPRSTYDNATGAGPDSWRRTSAGYVRATVVADAVLAAVVTAAALEPSLGWGMPVAVSAAAGGLVWPAVVAAVRGYSRKELGAGPAEFQAVLRAALAVLVALMAVAYVAQVDVPRLLVLVGVPLLAGLSAVDRYRRRRGLHRGRRAGTDLLRTVVVGDETTAGRVLAELELNAHHGYGAVGVCVPDPEAALQVAGYPVVGGYGDVVQVVVDHAADVVVVTGGALRGEALRRLSWALERVGAQLVVAPDLVEVAGPRLTVRATSSLSLLEVEVGAPRRRLLAKAVLDRTLGSLILLAASPVVLVSAVAVALTSPGGAFFRQQRVGLDGTTFTMWKLRTMYQDAEERRLALLASSDGNGLLFKMKADPRVTAVGKHLRRFSIDELPQLWNVVRGDMSLVGPRPPLLEEVAEYSDPVGRRLHVRPGLTGLWQVSGRSNLDWESSVRLDLRYVDNWSVAMDLMILWKTGRAVLGGSGAY